MQSLEWAVGTVSTTGYGGDTAWRHPAMVAFVIVVQIIAIFLVPIVIVLYLIPFLAERFEQRVPRRASETLSNHVVVFRHGPAVETLVQRLRSASVPSLVVELDESRARGVMESGQPVVFSRSEEDALDVARIDAARAIVANGSDEENAALILRARQAGFRGEVYAFVEEPSHRKAMELAGAPAAYTPRHIVAAALAAHASEVLSPRLPGLDAIGRLKRRDVRTNAGGQRIGDVDHDVVVVGQWVRSRLIAPCPAGMRIEPGAVLEMVGDDESIARAADAIGGTLLRDRGPFLVAGFGEVGRKVHQLLTDVGEEVRVIERQRAADVDVVGDVLDSSVLARAGLAGARALILALDSDDSTLFATVVSRDSAPNTAVIARVNHGRNVDNIHRAGADYALSISDVSGEMLSARLLKQSARARDEHRRVVRVDRTSFGGRTVDDLRRSDGGVSVLAADADSDAIWLCGTTDAIRAIISHGGSQQS